MGQLVIPDIDWQQYATDPADFQTLYDLYTKLELPFVEIIVGMEMAGMCFDPRPLVIANAQLIEAYAETKAKLKSLVGVPFNVRSSEQCQSVLYLEYSDDLTSRHNYHIPIPPKRQWKDKQSPPTDRITLAPHIENPVVQGILQGRAILKLQSTYINGLPNFVESDGRIHASINQTGTETGRISSRNPNMTNIPARQREDVETGIAGSAIREAFVAPDQWDDSWGYH